jgi:hypothetical protein
MSSKKGILQKIKTLFGDSKKYNSPSKARKAVKNFKNQDKPIIAPFSGDDYKPSFFLEIDLMQAIDDFFAIRAETLKQARALTLTDWDKTAIHPEYKIYTPYVLLRHLLMHDHSHLYKIEDMGFGITNKS